MGGVASPSELSVLFRKAEKVLHCSGFVLLLLGDRYSEVQNRDDLLSVTITVIYCVVIFTEMYNC